jgi:hypothetical protein
MHHSLVVISAELEGVSPVIVCHAMMGAQTTGVAMLFPPPRLDRPEAAAGAALFFVLIVALIRDIYEQSCAEERRKRGP